MELTLDQALQKGIEAHKAGKVQEADRYYTAILKATPKHPDANHNMGVLAVGVGKVREAIPFFENALKANQTNVQFWLSYMDAIINLGQIEDARLILDRAKETLPGVSKFKEIEKKIAKLSIVNPTNQYPEANRKVTENNNRNDPPESEIQTLISLYNLGQFQNSLNKTGNLIKKFPQSFILYNIFGLNYANLNQMPNALAAFTKTVKLKPNFAEGYNNLGAILKKLGHYDEALNAYSKATELKPDNAEAYSNIGNLLKEMGSFDEAFEACTKAVNINPKFAAAHVNLGVVHERKGRRFDAIKACIEALKITPNFREAYSCIGVALKGIVFSSSYPELQNIITSLLEEKTLVRPDDIAKPIVSLLRFDPILKKYLNGHSKVLKNNSFQQIVSDLSKVPLLIKLMRVSPIPDLKTENLLRTLRMSLLLNNPNSKMPKDFLKFQSALALQCFTNEYIYSKSRKEKKILKKLEDKIKRDLDKEKQPSSYEILCVASYKALNQYDWVHKLYVTNEIREVYTRQFWEPNEEAVIKASLPSLGGITDEVSSKVRNQYEDSPYPRWVYLGLPLEPAPISKVLKDIKIQPVHDEIYKTQNPQILVAGCGTGRHSISTAAQFMNSTVTAIDLSQSSLSYAARKTMELKLKNIDYIQADLLNLSQLNKKFDIIECQGVLHHMDNPLEGWTVLTNCLKSYGLMRIGLYSDLARQDIKKIRKEIEVANIKPSDEGMRKFRDIMVETNKSYFRSVASSFDFYSLSTFRDAVFHVKEHRFTIPKIKDYLQKLGLKFCGFESDLVTHFTQTYTCLTDLYDLDKWKEYEASNPNAFRGMYQFWCQKF